MKLTFDLEGTIAYLHPNQVNNERAVQSSLCLFVCFPSVCVHVRMRGYLFSSFFCVCFGDVCAL